LCVKVSNKSDYQSKPARYHNHVTVLSPYRRLDFQNGIFSPACGISVGVAKKAVRDWTNRNHKEYWENVTGLTQAKGLILGPSARRTKDLFKLNRDQLGWVVGLLTGHCHLKGHLLKLGLTDDPTCERCLKEDKSATHILCDCEAVADVRFRHLGQFFMEPSDYYDAPIDKVLHFIRGVGLIKG
jgi:hypothetical protein